MLTLNLGIQQSKNIQPEFAYGIMRSSLFPLDVVMLAGQGYLIGKLFGNSAMGAKLGAIMAVADRLFVSTINTHCPGKCYHVVGLPLGVKNFSLAAASLLTGFGVLQVAKHMKF